MAGVAEAEVMANVALGLGVPASAVLIESGSDRTRTQGLAVARIARDRRIHSILLVTSPAHAYRARRVFQKLGLEVISTPPDSLRRKSRSIVVRPDHVLDRIGGLAPALYEYAAIAFYWWRGWI